MEIDTELEDGTPISVVVEAEYEWVSRDEFEYEILNRVELESKLDQWGMKQMEDAFEKEIRSRKENYQELLNDIERENYE